MNKSNICLALLYNHRYDQNISRLETIYGDRFRTIVHIMPFYDGDKSNVIPVYENSYRFSGYIAQSFQRLLSLGSNTYVFVADDLILSPLITESNILDSLELAGDVPYIDGFTLHGSEFWHHCKAVLMEPHALGSEGGELLPATEKALHMLKKNGFEVVLRNGLRGDAIYGSKKSVKASLMRRLQVIMARYFGRKTHPHWKLAQDPLFAWNASLPYPMIGGYSDFFIVPRKNLKYFAHLCGILASMNVFVEMALPTALNLSSEKCKSVLPDSFRGGAIWDSSELQALGTKYNFSIDALLKDFPENKLFLHPIKLSRWK